MNPKLIVILATLILMSHSYCYFSLFPTYPTYCSDLNSVECQQFGLELMGTLTTATAEYSPFDCNCTAPIGACQGDATTCIDMDEEACSLLDFNYGDESFDWLLDVKCPDYVGACRITYTFYIPEKETCIPGFGCTNIPETEIYTHTACSEITSEYCDSLGPLLLQELENSEYYTDLVEIRLSSLFEISESCGASAYPCIDQSEEDFCVVMDDEYACIAFDWTYRTDLDECPVSTLCPLTCEELMCNATTTCEQLERTLPAICRPTLCDDLNCVDSDQICDESTIPLVCRDYHCDDLVCDDTQICNTDIYPPVCVEAPIESTSEMHSSTTEATLSHEEHSNTLNDEDMVSNNDMVDSEGEIEEDEVSNADSNNELVDSGCGCIFTQMIVSFPVFFLGLL
eukprot:TRINITY_DN10752_c0_g1_i1.p1 TRINITY_DN10752_c0_g1~~TRINITY_DN10752_c0_g1_i1.p1  ORF type:complete len:399 (-),score=79.41 TRINITY_DN10752_c0_g1_i1:167-1363(-)